ncbi:lipoprotein-releasing system permease protein [Hymenobacter luteus]|uniref:Lipoprotein-releasing system permease protein n=2 Tax=Hymenobacter TaxID=89966 RepID=A0A7W9WAT7_9BACT|nr:FtsX-like permease family protein [Hymenobacter latericoloratus]MBB4599393.1 lipoprotein-releasing system permease protein [Hymenobacter latericoloratus]MBB6058298.1 lipoprotein-releasing system permease protein [Hymenobacter luteus]
MNVSLLIARRYFLSKKKRNIISIISNISMVGVAIGTMALIIVLSVFNGLEEVARSLYGKSDPDLMITAVQGKSFEVNPAFIKQIKGLPGVALVTEVIEDNALLQYRDRQMVVKMKGVSDNYYRQSNIDSAIVEGSSQLHRDGMDYALLGAGVQHELSIALDNRFSPMRLLYPRNTGRKTLSMNPETAFNEQNILAGGVFLIEQHVDDSYIFVPLEFARTLLHYENRRTALEVKVQEDQEIGQVKEALKQQLGAGFKVLDSDEQHLSLLKAIKVEKMFVFITFAFILLIASINIFFSLSMLVIDKHKDIAVLMAMGASSRTIRNIFLLEGAIVAQVGAFTGLVLGVGICWAQQTFHLVGMGMATSVVDSYPVKMQFSDIALTGVAIIFITIVVSIRPALNAASLDLRENL